MSLLSQSQQLARSGARWRTDLYGIRVTLGAATTWQGCSKSPSKSTRMQNEQGTGYVQRTLATFMTLSSWATRPAIGSEFTIQESLQNPADVGTVWRVFDYTASVSGEEDRSVCFRLD